MCLDAERGAERESGPRDEAGRREEGESAGRAGCAP